jgi:hypothetical protein
VPNGVRFSAQILQLLALKCSKTQTLIQTFEVGAVAEVEVDVRLSSRGDDEYIIKPVWRL